LQAFVTHLLFVHTLSASTFFAIVPAFWWLGLLAQFYLIFPWLLRVFDRVGAGLACVGVCGLSWLSWLGMAQLAQHDPGSWVAMVEYLAYFNLPVRLPEFAIGMWLASAWNRALPPVQAPQPPAVHASRSALPIVPLLVGLALFTLVD
jgi:peptidoglycan/LPS O-acetylase OafA/YrhL